MKKTAIIGIYLAGLLCASCTDDLLPSASGEMEDAGGIAFGVSVVEQADMIYDYGRTRAAAGEPALDSATIVANNFGAHAMEGDNPWGVNIHRMPLPFVGIHPGSASTDKEQLATRAPLSEIAGNDLLFHDSLTIWGCVYDPATDYHRFLFNQTLLKKVSGWRSSVHWPYDEGKGKYMRFCAISPAFESMDITLVSPPEYKEGGILTPPTFRYNVPENPGEQRDVLFGCAGAAPAISVTDGPNPGYGGSGTGYYEGQASTQKEQHLGQDDKIINITFQHILSAVRFAQGKMPEGVTIKRITLAHIKSQGVYDPGQVKWGDKTGNPLTWSDDLPEVYSTYTIYPNKSITSYEENVYIDGDSVLFLMPQTLVEGAELQIVLTEASASTVERTLKCSLKDDVWNPGYTVTYKVTIGELKGEYYLVLDTGTGGVTIPKHGETGNETKYSNGAATHETSTSTTSGSFIIHSFRNAKDYSTSSSGTNKHQKADWQMTGFSWDGTGTYSANNRPAWLQSITGWTNVSHEVGQSAGNKTPSDAQGQQTIDYVLEAQSYTHHTTHSAVLALNPAVSNFDLSSYQPDGTSTGTSKTRESANCYIVNAEGNYKFPAVYGNGISGGTTRDLSSNTLFLDHLGKPITSPNIYKQINSYPYEETESGNVATPIHYRNTSSDALITKTEYDALSSSEKANYVQHELKWKRFTKISYDKTANTGSGNPSAISQELIWQDASGLFSVNATAGTNSYEAFSDASEGGFGFVEFTVNTSAAKPGNCVIALKGRRTTSTVLRYYSDDACTTQVGDDVVESSTLAPESEREILWTWHIWMTDEVYPNQTATKVGLADGAVTNDGDQRSAPTKTKTMDELYPSYYNGLKIVQLSNYEGTSTGMLPVNLGWVPDDDVFGLYQQRDTWVEIQLKDAPDKKVHFHIHQDAKPDLITGTSTMYQWGRPTALPMVKTMANATRTVYDKSGTDITGNFEVVTPTSGNNTTNHIPEAIKNPTKMIHKSADHWWNDGNNHLYWNTAKTLYDPCPPGFQVPTIAVFTGMTTDASLSTTESAALNMWLTPTHEYGDKKGGYFYATKHTEPVTSVSERYGPKYYFPSTGYYSGNANSGVLSERYNDRSVGTVWTTDHSYTETKWAGIIYFNTSSGKVKSDMEQNVDAHAIRPVSTTTSP